MLRNATKISAKGSYITMGTRGTAAESRIGGVTSVSYEASEAGSTEFDMLDEESFQETETPGPGKITVASAIDEISKEYQDLYDSFTGVTGSLTLNWYKGKGQVSHDPGSTARMAVAKSGNIWIATLTVVGLPWGDARRKGSIAKGMVLQGGTDATGDMYRIDKLASDFDYNDNTKWKLIVTPLVKSDGTLSPDTFNEGAYRVVTVSRVHENFQAAVTQGDSSNTDISNPVVQGNITFAPIHILPVPRPLAYGTELVQ